MNDRMENGCYNQSSDIIDPQDFIMCLLCVIELAAWLDEGDIPKIMTCAGKPIMSCYRGRTGLLEIIKDE